MSEVKRKKKKKKALVEIKYRWDIAEEKVNKLEEIAIETIQKPKQNENKEFLNIAYQQAVG